MTIAPKTSADTKREDAKDVMIVEMIRFFVYDLIQMESKLPTITESSENYHDKTTEKGKSQFY